jgi:hypothetical protein
LKICSFGTARRTKKMHKEKEKLQIIFFGLDAIYRAYQEAVFLKTLLASQKHYLFHSLLQRRLGEVLSIPLPFSPLPRFPEICDSREKCQRVGGKFNLLPRKVWRRRIEIPDRNNERVWAEAVRKIFGDNWIFSFFSKQQGLSGFGNFSEM